MTDPAETVVRVRAHVHGQVQGVGFRPFVWREATARGLAGWVGNDAAGVVLEIEGSGAVVGSLLRVLHDAPALARVERVVSEPVAVEGGSSFTVRDSDLLGARRALVSPDTATCADCWAELDDPADRRYGHPFITCTACGPRYTIVRSVPYDRSRTTMASFPLCPDCAAEYADPADRRFHAEPVCCPRCGPSLRLLEGGQPAVEHRDADPIAAAARLLRSGAIVAVKGLGGYHLAVDAGSEDAVARLRSRKHREDRPFALMVAVVEDALALCHVDADELTLLASPARPIVLLTARHDLRARRVAPSVARGAPTLGVMLAYTPVHALLLRAFGGPLVMTSGNLSDEPIAFDDADAEHRLGAVADAFLTHDRGIRTRVDDSVARVVGGRVLPVRRSRGYVPTPVPLAGGSPQPVLACGSALKNTFCVVREAHAFVSHHIGDLDDWATLRSYTDGIEHLSALLDVEPLVIAHDLHPDYPSTRYALERGDVRLIGVQHHHAHIASCLADNGRQDQVIGVAFDGVGLGADGLAWGGEVLIADLNGFTRAAHLAEVALPGGDRAVREPWRMALSHLDAAFGGEVPAGLAVVERQGRRWEQVLSVARAGVNAPLTSSAGRLFDAVAALVGVRDIATYEGQAAVELEHAADPGETGSYDVPVTGGVMDVGELVRRVTADVLAGVPTAAVAGRFHNALASVVLTVCRDLRDLHGISTVALSGGVFQNALLVTRCLDGLAAASFEVLTHHQVPPNDGGLSLGQAAVAAAALRTERSGA